MSEPPVQPPPPPEKDQTPPSRFEAQRDITAGRDIAGRDIAGRDIVAGDVVTKTTYVGFSQQAVISLVVVVGMLVFITAACFFSGGIALGVGIFAALQRPVDNTPAAALSMQKKINDISAMPAGQSFNETFTEQELSSYFHFIAGPKIGMRDGEVRLVSSNEMVVSGKVDQLGGRTVVATFEVQTNSPQPLRLTKAAVQTVNTGSPFGWTYIPAAVLQPYAGQINNLFQGNVEFKDVSMIAAPVPGNKPVQPAWKVNGVIKSSTP